MTEEIKGGGSENSLRKSEDKVKDGAVPKCVLSAPLSAHLLWLLLLLCFCECACCFRSSLHLASDRDHEEGLVLLHPSGNVVKIASDLSPSLSVPSASSVLSTCFDLGCW